MPDRRFVLDTLRDESVGGTLLLVATGTALVWANSPWSTAYQSLRSATVGPAAVHLDLDLTTWAADRLRVGFTGPLLIGELAFATDPERSEHVTMAVLFGSLLAARIAGVLLRMRHRAYVRMREDEQDLDSASTERLAFGKET